MNPPLKNLSSFGKDDFVVTRLAVLPETSHWSYELVPALIWLKAMLTPAPLGAIEGKNWLPPVLSTRVAVVPDHRYARPTPVSYDVHTTRGEPFTTASAGNELLRKLNPGKGLGRSLKPAGLIVTGTFQAVPSKWASLMDPTVADADGYSSQAIQKPPFPSAWMEDPCEKTEPGTLRTALGATEVAPVGKTATLIGAVTLTPEQEPNWVQDSQTCEPSIASAGLSWN